MTPGIIVVAFGAPELLRRTLAPVRGYDVVVVDNSSRRDVRDVCATQGVRYVDPGRNSGFACAVNRGIAELGMQRDLLLLNPDAVVTATGIQRLAAALQAQPRIAAVAPRLTGPAGDQRVNWPWPTPAGMWREAVGLPQRSGDYFLVGAVLMVAGQALRDVGTFDERFFLYAEETDWQRRAVDGGWQVRLVEDVVAEHLGAGTSPDLSRRETLFHAGTETYLRKHFGRRGWLSYRLAALSAAVLRSALPGARGARARHRVSLYARGPRRAAGFE